MKGKAFTILNTSPLLEIPQIMAARTLKKKELLTDSEVQTSLDVFSGFCVSIYLG